MIGTDFAWMVVDLPLEEQLALEKHVRAARDCGDVDEIKELCGDLLKQSVMQKNLLRQAVGRIAELEQQKDLAKAAHMKIVAEKQQEEERAKRNIFNIILNLFDRGK